MTTQCISRLTDELYARPFGDGKHRFYLETRCPRPCMKDSDVCEKCIDKPPNYILQYTYKYNHGRIHEPIPDKSHIYGGKWYHMRAKEWGSPSQANIEVAIMYQLEARNGYVVVQPTYEDDLSKAKQPSRTMGRKAAAAAVAVAAVKPTTNVVPVIDTAVDATTVPVDTIPASTIPVTAVATTIPATTSVTAAPVKRAKKPKVVADDTAEPAKAPVKRTRKPKEEPKLCPSLQPTERIHKEVSLPTYIEKTMEEFDTDGYSIEYVKLTPFELGQTSYFRDRTKNKLYKKHKDNRIGDYVGRYDPNTDSLITDVLDSDDETM